MTSRRNSDASARLRRAKSASSVPLQRNNQPAASDNRAGTHDNARTAASLAFQRAKTVHATEETRPRLSRSSSKPSVHQPRVSVDQPRISGEGSHLSRRNSRHGGFAERKPVAREARHTLGYAAIPQPAVHPPPKSVSTDGDVFSITSPEQRFADRYDGYGVPFEARLRRAKSTQGYPSTQSKASITPSPIRRSLTVKAPTIRENQTDEAIIALARDRYLKDNQAKPLRKRSSFFAPLLGKSRKAKRDSLITLNTEETISQGKPSIEIPVPATTVLEHHPIQTTEIAQVPSAKKTPRPDLPIEKPRKSSGPLSGLKNTLKRTFTRSSRSSSGSSGLPPQHIRSKRHSSRGPPIDTNDWADQSITAWPGFEDPSSSPPTPPPHRSSIITQGSWNGKNNFADEAHDVHLPSSSRVTSWHDSTRQTTLTTTDLEHLPIIAESPDSRQMSTYNAQNKSSDLQNQLNQVKKSTSRFSLKGKVDSRRLVSALLRHSQGSSGDEQPVMPVHKPSLPSLPRKSTNTARSAPAAANRTAASRHPAMEAYLAPPSAGNRSSVPHYYFGESSSSDSGDFATPTRPQRANVISPSVYSERADDDVNVNAMSGLTRPVNAPGMATVLDSHAVARWSLENSKSQHKHSTSNEWRAWMADETAGLEGRASFSLPAFSASDTTISAHERQISRSTVDDTIANRQASNPDTPDWIDEPPPKPSARQVSFEIPRKTSVRQVSFELTRKPLEKSLAQQRSLPFFGRKFSKPRKAADDSPPASPTEESTIDAAEPSGVDLLARPRVAIPTGTAESDANRLSKARNKLRRFSNLSSRMSVAGTPPSKTSPKTGPNFTSPNMLDENFLLRIRKGPYNASTNSLARPPTGSSSTINLPKRSPAQFGKENTPPSSGQRMADAFLSSRGESKDKGNTTPALV